MNVVMFHDPRGTTPSSGNGLRKEAVAQVFSEILDLALCAVTTVLCRVSSELGLGEPV